MIYKRVIESEQGFYDEEKVVMGSFTKPLGICKNFIKLDVLPASSRNIFTKLYCGQRDELPLIFSYYNILTRKNLSYSFLKNKLCQNTEIVLVHPKVPHSFSSR